MYVNTWQGVLAHGLQNLNQQEMWDVNHYPMISHGFISSNSAMNVEYNYYNYASTNTSNPGYFGGMSFDLYTKLVAKFPLLVYDF